MSISLFLAAVVPSLWIVNYFRKGDRFPEPTRVIVTTFVLGIAITLPIIVLVALIKSNVTVPDGVFSLALHRAFYYAAIPEELLKFLVLFFYCIRHDEFDEPMDGLVYGVTVSLGFAAIENVVYVAGGGWSLAIMRAVTSVPLHGLNGAIMGYLIAYFCFARVGRWKWLVLAIVVPVLMHGLWNSTIYAMPHTSAGLLLVLPALLLLQYVLVKRFWLHFDRLQGDGQTDID